MFGNAHFEHVRQLFADQFEADGTAFLYRKNMKGAPIRVTEAERDAFVADFRRRLRYAIWSIMPSTFLLIGLLVLLVPDVRSARADLFVWIGLAAVMAPFLFMYYWAWNAPARELDRRPPAGEARSREEVRQLMFARMTYGQLGLAVVTALLLVWRMSADNDVFHGWGVLWLVFAGLLIVGAAIQAFRKWRHERG